MSALTDLIDRINAVSQTFAVNPSIASLVSLKVLPSGPNNTKATIIFSIEGTVKRRKVLYNRLDLKTVSDVQEIPVASDVLADIIDDIRTQTNLPLTVDTLTVQTATDGSKYIVCTPNNPAYTGKLKLLINSEEQ